jgi:hypothetical protein
MAQIGLRSRDPWHNDSVRACCGVMALSVLVIACGDDSVQGASSSGGGGETVVVPPTPNAGLGVYACPPGELVLPDGACHPAGTPASGCPSGFEQLGDSCQPILPTAPCPDGQVAYPGERQCHLVASCAAGKWGDIPTDPTTQYVDQSFVGVSDGSELAPWTTVQQGVDAASSGDVVAIAAGTYGGTVFITAAVKLWGVCPELTILTTQGSEGAIRIDAADATEVHMLSVAGEVGNFTGIGGIGVTDSDNVTLEHLWFHDLSHRGLLLESSSVLVRDVLIQDARYFGIFSQNGDVTLERVAVRDTTLSAAGQYGRGISMSGFIEAAVPDVSLTDVVVDNSRQFGVFASDVNLSVNGLVVRNTVAQDHLGAAGVGFWVQSQISVTTLVGRGIAVTDAQACGICALSTNTDLEAVSVQSVTTNAVYERDGYGLALFRRPSPNPSPTLRVHGATIRDTQGAGVVIDGADALLEAIVIDDVKPFVSNRGGGLGRGVSAQDNPTAGVATTLVMRGSTINNVRELGMLLMSEGELETLAISNVAATRDGLFGRGIDIVLSASAVAPRVVIKGSAFEALEDIGIATFGVDLAVQATHVHDVGGFGISFQHTGQSALEGSIQDCLVEQTTGVGIIVVGADVSIERTLVRGTQVLPADGTLGDALVVQLRDTQTARANLASCHLVDNARAGAATFSATLELVDTFLECNAIHLNGETLFGPFELIDTGGNVCGCSGDIVPCKTLSSTLNPPSPPDSAPNGIDAPPPPDN